MARGASELHDKDGRAGDLGCVCVCVCVCVCEYKKRALETGFLLTHTLESEKSKDLSSKAEG